MIVEKIVVINVMELTQREASLIHRAVVKEYSYLGSIDSTVENHHEREILGMLIDKLERSLN